MGLTYSATGFAIEYMLNSAPSPEVQMVSIIDRITEVKYTSIYTTAVLCCLVEQTARFLADSQKN